MGAGVGTGSAIANCASMPEDNMPSHSSNADAMSVMMLATSPVVCISSLNNNWVSS